MSADSELEENVTVRGEQRHRRGPAGSAGPGRLGVCAAVLRVVAGPCICKPDRAIATMVAIIALAILTIQNNISQILI